MSAIQFFQTTPEKLAELINEGVKCQLENFRKELKNSQECNDLLTRKEAAKFLKISTASLTNWTNDGRIVSYSISGKRYYKKKQLVESLTELKK